MAIVALAMPGPLFVAVIVESGSDFYINPVFWVLFLLVLTVVIGFIYAGKITSKFGKEHYDKDVQKGDYWTLPHFAGFTLGFIFIMMRDVIWNLVIGLLFFSATAIFRGVLSIKKKMFMAYGVLKLSEDASIIAGWMLIIIGILFSLAAIIFSIIIVA